MSASGNKKEVDGRVKPGLDGGKRRGFRRVAAAAALGVLLATGIFAAWVASLGP